MKEVNAVATPGPDRPVFGIAVAAELAGSGPQNLRAYEKAGLVTPARTDGGTRRYSQDDVDRLRRVKELMDAGLNLAGVAMVMDLQDENRDLHDRLHGGKQADESH